MTEGAWLVVFRGQLTDEMRGAITAAGFTLTGSHGGGVIGSSGDLPEMNSHTVRVEAASEGEAVEHVRRALEPHGTVGDPTAQPA